MLIIWETKNGTKVALSLQWSEDSSKLISVMHGQAGMSATIIAWARIALCQAWIEARDKKPLASYVAKFYSIKHDSVTQIALCCGNVAMYYPEAELFMHTVTLQ